MTMLQSLGAMTRAMVSCAIFGILAAPPSEAAESRWSAGPSGGAGGRYFQDFAMPDRPAYVTSITVRHGTLIDAIQTDWWVPAEGRVKSSDLHGGTGGRLSKFDVEGHRGMYVYAVWGYADKYVNSLGFAVSDGGNEYDFSDLYGGYDGGNFSYYAPAGYEIAGFRGRSGKYLDAVGVIIRKR